MLNSMREGAGGVIVKILMVLLVASFAVWGIGDVTSVRSDLPYVVKVGDEEISQPAFENRLRQNANQLSRMVQGKIDQDTLEKAVIPSTLRSLIQESIFEQEFSRLNLSISDNVMEDILKNDTNFQTDGSFDRNKFRNILRHNRITERNFLQENRKKTGRQFLQDALTFEIPAPKTLVDVYNQYDNSKKEFSFIKVKVADSLDEVPEASKEQLEKIYSDNLAAFAVQETRSVNYISISPKALQERVEVSEEEIKQYYDTNKDKYDSDFTVAKVEAKIDLENEKAEKELDRVLDEVEAGITEATPLKTIAEKISETVKNIPSIDQAGRGYVLNKDFLPNILELKEGGLTDLLDDNDNYYIFEAEKVNPARTKEFAEVSEDLTKIWERQNKEEAAKNKAEDLYNSAKESSLQEVAKKNSLNIKKTGLFSRTNFGQEAKGIRVTQPTLKELFALKKDEVSKPIAFTGSNGVLDFYILAKLDNAQEAAAVAEDKVDQAKSKIASEMRRDILENYTGYLQNYYGVQFDMGRLGDGINIPDEFKEN